MKKIISVLLVAVMIFSLCACDKDKLVGKWYNDDYDITIKFNKDGTCVYTESDDEPEEFEWELKDERIYVDGDETDLKFEDGKLTMEDGGEVIKFKKVKLINKH